MKRLSSIVSAVALASAFATVGCKKKEEKVDEAAATKPAEGTPAGATPTTPTAADPATPPADPAAAAGAAPAAGAAVTEPSAEEKAIAEKAVAMLEELAAAADANSADCNKAAAAMQGIVDKSKDLIEKGKELDKDPGKKAWFEQTYQGRVMGSMGKMVPLMEKCKDNAALLKVFSSMER